MASANPQQQGDAPAKPASGQQQQQGGSPVQQKPAPQKPGTRFTDWASI